MLFIWHRKTINTLYKADCEQTLTFYWLHYVDRICFRKLISVMSCVPALCPSSSIQGDRFTLSYIYLTLNQSTEFSWYELILRQWICGRGGRGRGGSASRRSSFVGKLVLIAAASVVTFSFPFCPVACCGARGQWLWILPHSDWGVKCGGPLPPLPWKEQICWLQYTATRKRRLHMTSKTLFLFFHSKTWEGVAPSSPLSQSTVVYSSEHLISIWRGWGRRRGGRGQEGE